MLHTKFRGKRSVGTGDDYDGLESPMLHAKFLGNRPASSGEEDF